MIVKEFHRKWLMREARLNAELGSWLEGRYSGGHGPVTKARPGLCRQLGAHEPAGCGQECIQRTRQQPEGPRQLAEGLSERKLRNTEEEHGR